MVNALAQRRAEVTFPGLDLSVEKLVESTCYKALEHIKAIVQDDSLSDPECFKQIEEIVLVLEDMGSGGGFRHDF